MKTSSDIKPTTTSSYEDFEPFCKWYKEEDKETIEVHVQGFKREQLKVHISNRGILKITGECPIDESTWSRFNKEIRIPKHCDTNKINAKFTRSPGHLFIVLPKKANLTYNKQDQATIRAKKPESNFVGFASRNKKVAYKVLIAMSVLAMGVYAMYTYNRSSFVSLPDSSEL